MDLPSDVRLRLLRHDPLVEEEHHRLLSEAERRCLATFSHPGRRTAFILGRGAARTLAAEELGMEPAHVRIDVEESGALVLPDSALHLSIAHSGSYAAAVIGHRPVGVDLERIRPTHAGLAARLLAEDEQEMFRHLPLSDEAACILCWTLKEAVLKGMRSGLRTRLTSVSLSIIYEAHRAVVRDADGSNWEAAFEEHDGHFVSVAYRGAD